MRGTRRIGSCVLIAAFAACGGGEQDPNTQTNALVEKVLAEHSNPQACEKGYEVCVSVAGKEACAKFIEICITRAGSVGSVDACAPPPAVPAGPPPAEPLSCDEMAEECTKKGAENCAGMLEACQKIETCILSLTECAEPRDARVCHEALVTAGCIAKPPALEGQTGTPPFGMLPRDLPRLPPVGCDGHAAPPVPPAANLPVDRAALPARCGAPAAPPLPPAVKLPVDRPAPPSRCGNRATPPVPPAAKLPGDPPAPPANPPAPPAGPIVY